MPIDSDGVQPRTKGDASMGLRSRNRRNNRRRQRERARRRRGAMMSVVRPECPECGTSMAREESIAEMWRCRSCARSFLKMGAELAPEVQKIIVVNFDAPPIVSPLVIPRRARRRAA